MEDNQTIDKAQWNHFQDHLDGNYPTENELRSYNAKYPKSALVPEHIEKAIDEISRIKSGGYLPDLQNHLTKAYKKNPNNFRFPVHTEHGYDYDKLFEKREEKPSVPEAAAEPIEEKIEEVKEPENKPEPFNPDTHEDYKREKADLDSQRQKEIASASRFNPTLNFLSKEKLRGKSVQMDAEVEETGEIRKVKMPALKAHNEIKKRLDALGKINDHIHA